MASRRISKRELLGLGAERLADLVLALAAKHPSAHDAVHELLLSGPAVPAAKQTDPEAAEPYMVGSSPAMRDVFTTIRKFASVDASVLITGESGTGKELAAHAIHERSTRAQGPFVVIDCATLPPTLIGSELFGHERGAFTDAHERKIGRIERANGGTVFLDEVGDLPMEMQAHLLRFLQEGTIERIGGKGPLMVDARVIAATNADLAAAKAADRFREDLFYRLNVLTLEMPPLRARDEDIELLATFFLKKLAQEMDRPIRGFADDALRAVRAYRWPGNVRELIACIRRAVVMTDGQWIDVADLGIAATLSSIDDDPVMTLQEARDHAEGHLVRRTLELHRHNVKKTAEELDVSRPTLYRLMEKHGIRIHGEESSVSHQVSSDLAEPM